MTVGCNGMLGPALGSFSGELGCGTTARMPERKDLEPVACGSEAEIEVIVNTCDVDAPDVGKCDVPSTSSNARLQRDEEEDAFEFVCDGGARIGPVFTPPR